MANADLRPYYLAGIGVAATKFGIGLKLLSLQRGAAGSGAVLHPVRKWCKLDVSIDDFKILQLEEYIMTCLAGSAARCIRLEDLRGPLKQSLGNADLELEQLREMWQCSEPETDRAFALVFGSFGQIDDGDSDATLYRLWRRTLHLLRMPKHYDQLNRLARRLYDVTTMSGEEISTFLDC
jgi:hypothetical protein